MFKSISLTDHATAINITIDGRPLRVPQGITVAAAALSNGFRHTRSTPVSSSKRAPFCLMGVCFECLMVIDGKANQRACATYVREGMSIKTQVGVGPAIEGVLDE